MKKNLIPHLVLFFATIGCSNVFSAELFNNGVPIFEADRCISGPNQCGDMNGQNWVIYDDFTLASNSVITGFSNWNGFGRLTDYLNTSWSIWSNLNVSPSSNKLEGQLIASGTNIGENKFSDGFNKIIIDGINIDLDAGTYWLGISHILQSGSTPYTYVASDAQRVGNVIQSIGNEVTLNAGIESAFTVNGQFKNAPPVTTIPEPSNSTLLLSSVGLISFVIGRRKFK